MIPPTNAKVVPNVDDVPNDDTAPMTSAQADILRTLCEDTGESFDASLTEGQAEARIAELKEKSQG